MTDEQAPSAALAPACDVCLTTMTVQETIWRCPKCHSTTPLRDHNRPHTQEGGESVGGRDDDSSPAVAAPRTSTAEALEAARRVVAAADALDAVAMRHKAEGKTLAVIDDGIVAALEYDEAKGYVIEIARALLDSRVVPLQSPSDAWRPIETAPRNGEHIFALNNDAAYGFGHFGTWPNVRCIPLATTVHWHDDGTGGGWWPSVNSDGRYAVPFHATHWRLIRGLDAEGNATESKLASTERPDRHPSPTRAEMVEARNKALEEAAQIAEGKKPIKLGNFFKGQRDQSDKIAASIRAILTKADSEIHERED